MIKTCRDGEGEVRKKHILSLEKGSAGGRTGHEEQPRAAPGWSRCAAQGEGGQ